MARKLMMNNNGSGSNVDYVQYIEGTGTQYIDTKIIPASLNWKYYIKFKDSVRSKYESYFGTSSAYVRLIRDVFLENLLFDYGGKSKQIIDTSIGSDFSEIYIGEGNFKINNIISYSFTTLTSIPNQTLLIFQSKYGTSLDNCGSFKLYDFKIYNNEDVLLYHFRPCLDNGVACLYEEVNKKYHYNTGTGNFNYSM